MIYVKLSSINLEEKIEKQIQNKKNFKKKTHTPPNFPLAASHKKMYKTQSKKNQNTKVQGEGRSLKMTGNLLTKK